MPPNFDFNDHDLVTDSVIKKSYAKIKDSHK